jgi:hypothetical protein
MSSNTPQIRSTQLQAEGWTRRFIALGRRLNEAAELYSQLGYEVRLEPVNLDEEESMGAESCKDCFVTVQARTIYTRPREVVKVGVSYGI